nr:hypothetical protein OH820_07220 [Streptomyces sp. NBC_00857]
MSVTDHRRLGIAAGTAFLILATTGCSGLGRTAVGTITYDTEQKQHVKVSSPLVTGCHRLGPGAVEVTNRTLVDLVMYRTPDCTGEKSAYIATTLSDVMTPGKGPWRSYTIVH